MHNLRLTSNRYPKGDPSRENILATSSPPYYGIPSVSPHDTLDQTGVCSFIPLKAHRNFGKMLIESEMSHKHMLILQRKEHYKEVLFCASFTLYRTRWMWAWSNLSPLTFDTFQRTTATQIWKQLRVLRYLKKKSIWKVIVFKSMVVLFHLKRKLSYFICLE